MTDFKKLGHEALPHAELLLTEWFPNGRRFGAEFKVGSLCGEKGESLSVNTATGKWKDFATGEGGGDLVSLFAASRGISQGEAARGLAKAIGQQGLTGQNPPAQPATGLTALPSVPSTAPTANFSHHQWGAPSERWPYHDALGRLVGYVCRFDPAEGKKQILPRTWCRDHAGTEGWHWKGFLAPRPLFDLHLLMSDPSKSVLIVEGEKTARAAQRLVGEGFIVTTWPGGSSAVGQTDWSPLHGRDVVVWPDADEPGTTAAALIQEALPSCRIVTHPPNVVKGWDLADAESEGWSRDRILHFISESRSALPSPEKPACPADLDGKFFVLPSAKTEIRTAAAGIFRVIGEGRRMFRRGGIVVEVSQTPQDAKLVPLSPEAFRSRLESYGRELMAWRDLRGEPVLAPARCSTDNAKALLATEEVGLLPEIVAVTRCPVLNVGGRILGHGYHPDAGGIYVTGKASPKEVPLDEAIAALWDSLGDFDFVSPGDRARAMAAILTPAMRMGGLIPGRGFAPVDVAEATESQSGKGYRQDLVAAIYGEDPYSIAQKRGGVGSLDESLSSAILSGRPFVRIDNLRGGLSSEWLESFLTNAGRTSVRVPYRGEVEVDGRAVTFQLSSNGFEATQDFVNRASFCRIRKRPSDYRFRRYPEGDLLEHVKARQSFYLGCVFAVLREWIRTDCPRTAETRHSFRDWAQTMDQIIGGLMVAGVGTLLEGHSEAAERCANPSLTWLRLIGAEIQRRGQCEREWRASELGELADETGIPQPGKAAGAGVETDAMAAGKILGRAFATGATLKIESLTVVRTERPGTDSSGKAVVNKLYRFTIISGPSGPSGVRDETPREMCTFPECLEPHTGQTGQPPVEAVEEEPLTI